LGIEKADSNDSAAMLNPGHAADSTEIARGLLGGLARERPHPPEP